MKKVILILVCLVLLVSLVAAGKGFWKAYSIMDNTPIYSAPCGTLLGTVQFTREKVRPGFFDCGNGVFSQRMDGTWFNIADVTVIP